MDPKLKDLLEAAANMYEMGQTMYQEFQHLFHTDEEGREKLLKMLSSWSHWYSLSHAEFVSISAGILGMASILSESSEHTDRLDANLAFISKAKDFDGDTEHITSRFGEDVAHKLVLQVVFANHFSQLAMVRRNRSINCMLEQIREKVDDYIEIIFEAVSIDASVVSNPEISNFVAQWTVEKDVENLDKLSKSIAGRYPRGKRDESLDQHRFMTAVLEEFMGSIRPETVDEMNQLLKLLYEGEDPVEAIRYHLRVRKKDTRRAKAH